MISGTGLVLIFIVSAIIYYLSKPSKFKGKLPPGPKGLPLIGNMHQMEKEIYKPFTKWAKEYGKIYTVKLASLRTVCVNDAKMIKEMFNDSVFTGRPDMSTTDLFENGTIHGIVNTEGEHWEELRRFTLRQLRDFGFGKNSLESSIMDEVNELHETIKSQNGKPIDDLKSKFTLAVVNSLWKIVSGKRYKQDDPKLIRLTKLMKKSVDDMADTGGLLFFAPWTRHIVPTLIGYTKFRELMDQFRGFFSDAVEEHKQQYDDSFAKDFIDVFLKQIKNTTDANSAFYGQIGEDQLVGTISDLFIAGSDTTSTTLEWAILYLTSCPEVQKKLQKEIDDVTGQSRPCSLSDRPNMPYAEAVLAETLRLSSIIPTGVGHRAILDKEFHGYLIPKDTVIFSGLYFIHHNPEIWGDAEEFRPERFLSPDGKSFKKHEALLAFSIGRRQCLGESLARDTLFLFLTNTIQQFSIKFDDKKPQPDLEPGKGFMLSPKPFDVIMEDRLA